MKDLIHVPGELLQRLIRVIIILAIDALEFDKVEEFNCINLMQGFYGKTDISDFSQPRTMVLWSSFMTGENKENEVLGEGNKEMWNKRWDKEDTFFNNFRNPEIIDLPGYSYDLKVHEESREDLKKFFTQEDKDKKELIRKKYNDDAFSHHKKIKDKFVKEIDNGHDLILGYFSVADVIGHLNFGNKILMKMIYKDLDELAGKCSEKECPLIILSDHGMEALGMFGDHSNYGFWSTNFKDLGRPKITDFSKIVLELLNPK